MFLAQIAHRAFNTPLLVEPSKAMAFLSGLGPRITGRQLRLTGTEVGPEDMAHAALPARAGSWPMAWPNNISAMVRRPSQWSTAWR